MFKVGMRGVVNCDYSCKPDMMTVKPHAVRSADSLPDGRKRFSSPEGSMM